MKRSNVYTVEFREHLTGQVMRCQVLAHNKAEAYDVAVYEEIPAITGSLPYSAWVYSVTYNNGAYHLFNTSEGNAY